MVETLVTALGFLGITLLLLVIFVTLHHGLRVLNSTLTEIKDWTLRRP